MNFGLVITTCKHYYANIPELIKQLDACHFPKQNILIVSGQEDEESIIDENDIKCVKVTYSGLHLTGLIHIYENSNLYSDVKYWIVLPDTINIGSSFYNIMLDFFQNYIKNDTIYSIPFINPEFKQTMDMGILHIKQIQSMGNYLLKLKLNYPYNKNDILKLKTQLVFDENIILGCSIGKNVAREHMTRFKYQGLRVKKPSMFLCRKNQIIEKEIIINGRIVNEVTFTNLDLIKYQRNYKGFRVPLITEL